MNSAAFQDHFMKNMKLDNLDPFKKKMNKGSGARPPRAAINGLPQRAPLASNGMNIVQTGGYQNQQ